MKSRESSRWTTCSCRDDTTWKTGAELLDGALLEVPVKSGATAEFFKVVVE